MCSFEIASKSSSLYISVYRDEGKLGFYIFCPFDDSGCYWTARDFTILDGSRIENGERVPSLTLQAVENGELAETASGMSPSGGLKLGSAGRHVSQQSLFRGGFGGNETAVGLAQWGTWRRDGTCSVVQGLTNRWGGVSSKRWGRWIPNKGVKQ